MRRFALVTAVLVLPIVAVLSVLACDVSPNPPTPVPAAEQPDGGEQTGPQAESAKKLDQPTPAGAAAVGTLEDTFPDRTEAEFVGVVESLIAGSGATETPKTAASETPDGVTWMLESVDGSPLTDDTFATVKVNADWYGGFDGCNAFWGRNEDGTLVAKPDGTFSAPGAAQTLMLCEGPDGIMEHVRSAPER